MIKIIFFGDVIGKIGRRALKKVIPDLRKKYKPDLIIANGENLAHGSGVTEKILREVKEMGVDFLTSGNHIWKKKEILDIFNNKEFKNFIIRPANWPKDTPGKGESVIKIGDYSVLIINLLGRVFIKEHTDCPFRRADEILLDYQKKKNNAIIVDFHAEATSEKVAMGHWLDGRVSAVLGTHTHIGTADVKILPKGMAYITDIGMVGAKDSIIGVVKEGPLQEFITQMPQVFEIPEKGETTINAVYLEINPKTKKAVVARRLDLETIID